MFILKLTKDEKLMLIVALGESTDEIEELLEIPSEVKSYEVFNKLLKGNFKLKTPQVEALIKILEHPYLRGIAIRALDRNYFGYESQKYSEEDFEKLSLSYMEIPTIYNSLVAKLKEEL